MCQGVIAIYDPNTKAYHWGIGSHNELIKKLWPNAKNTAEDKFLKIEANLLRGPGEFSVENRYLYKDDDEENQDRTNPAMLDEFKQKIIAQAGTVTKIIDFIQARTKEGFKMDDAFTGILTDKAKTEYFLRTEGDEDERKQLQEYTYDNSLTKKQRQLHETIKRLEKDPEGEANYHSDVMNVVVNAMGQIFFAKKFTSKRDFEKAIKQHNERAKKQAKTVYQKLVNDFVRKHGVVTIPDEAFRRDANKKANIIEFDPYDPLDFLTRSQRKRALSIIKRETKRLKATLPKMPPLKKGKPEDKAKVFIELASKRSNIAPKWKGHIK